LAVMDIVRFLCWHNYPSFLVCI